MSFLNKKEEVIDIELTRYGSTLLALGKFKPEFYAFFDEDILYDIEHMEPGDSGVAVEAQNATESRINTGTRVRPFSGFTEVIERPINESTWKNIVRNHDKPYRNEIRRSKVGVQESPAFKLKLHNGSIDSIVSGSGFGDDISQINCTIEYIVDENAKVTTAEEILLSFEEENVDYKMTNFDVEVFEVEEVQIVGRNNVETLRRLEFASQVADLFDEQTVSYFLDLEIDSEIDPAVMKDVVDKSKSIFVNRINTTAENPVDMADIYNTLKQDKACE